MVSNSTHDNFGYRARFLLAALLNFGLAISSGLFPEFFFGLFDTSPPDFPADWRWSSLVVGLFGAVYLVAAVRPTRADVLIAIGLTSKITGPLFWLACVSAERMSPRIFPVLLFGDVVWWLPLLAYLMRRTAWRDAVIVWLATAFHLAACVALLLIAPGTEASPDMSARYAWLKDSTALWTGAWFVWSLASLSLLAFCLVWARHLRRAAASRVWIYAGCTIVAVGLGCDLAGEMVMVVWAGHADTVEEFARAVRCYQWLSPAAANGLYCCGGLMLSYAAWHAAWLRGPLGVLGFVMWLIGLALTAFTVSEYRLLMTVSGAAVMLLFMPWAAAIGWRMRPVNQ